MNGKMTNEKFVQWGFRGSMLLAAYLIFVFFLPLLVVAESVQWLTIVLVAAAILGMAHFLWGRNDLTYLVRVQVEYTIFCAAAIGSLALMLFFLPLWSWQESLVFKAIGSGSTIAAVAALSILWSFNKKFPQALPRDLVQFGLKATAIVASVGFLVVYAIVILLSDEAPYPTSQQYLVLFSLGALLMIAMYNRRFGDNQTRGRQIAIKFTLLVVDVELVLAGYALVWLTISPKGSQIPWTQGLTWVLAFMFTVVMLSALGWFRKSSRNV